MARIDGETSDAPREVHNWRIYALAVCASMGSAMFGYDSAFIGGTMALPSFQSRFGLSDVSGTTLASLKANIVSTFQAGCFFGAILCHGATERLGRKYTLVACGIIFDVGVVLQLVSSGHIGLIYAGRAITGLAVGASSLLVPVYISECSPPAVRGRMVGANAINYYSPSIFASVGLSGRSVGLLATGVYGIIKVVATSLFIRFIVDRFGRRVPLLIGSAVALTSMLYLGIYCAVSDAFSGGASQGAGGIAWIFCAEIFPLGVPFIVVGIFFAYFLVPETARLTLEDMDILFSTKGSARHKRRAVDAILQNRQQNDEFHDDFMVEDPAKSQLEPTSKHVEESRL
uniref:Quinate transporter n=1 Tax=Fusarium oxysporum (strain Fo5176) TaxID=660025 RepID=A0A0D2XKZ8_FUSOF